MRQPPELETLQHAIAELAGGQMPHTMTMHDWCRVAGRLGLAVRFTDSASARLTPDAVIIPTTACQHDAQRIIAHEVVECILRARNHELARLAEEHWVCRPAAAHAAPRRRRPAGTSDKLAPRRNT